MSDGANPRLLVVAPLCTMHRGGRAARMRCCAAAAAGTHGPQEGMDMASFSQPRSSFFARLAVVLAVLLTTSPIPGPLAAAAQSTGKRVGLHTGHYPYESGAGSCDKSLYEAE